jgi:hypothetical protein
MIILPYVISVKICQQRYFKKMAIIVWTAGKKEYTLFNRVACSANFPSVFSYLYTLPLCIIEVVYQSDVKMRILTHTNRRTSGILDSLKSINSIDFRPLQESLQTRLTILIVDRKYSLEVEVKDDTKDNSSEAVELAT